MKERTATLTVPGAHRPWLPVLRGRMQKAESKWKNGPFSHSRTPVGDAELRPFNPEIYGALEHRVVLRG